MAIMAAFSNGLQDLVSKTDEPHLRNPQFASNSRAQRTAPVSPTQTEDKIQELM
jgi:hypothetical protein